jgi:hypothetical protein
MSLIEKQNKYFYNMWQLYETYEYSNSTHYSVIYIVVDVMRI